MKRRSLRTVMHTSLAAWRVVARVASASVVVLSALACDTPSATRPDEAFDPTTLTGGVRYRWASGTTIRVWVVNPSSAGFPIDLGLATRQAMTRWNEVAAFGEYTLKSATRIDEANIIVFDGVAPLPVSEGSCVFNPRGSAGYTYFCPGSPVAGALPRAELLWLTEGGPGITTVIIRLDRGRASSQSAYNAIVAHEFGHALGIGAHSDVSSDVMFALPTTEIPSARDRATLRWLLGQRPALLL
jgi:hypothetical protein